MKNLSSIIMALAVSALPLEKLWAARLERQLLPGAARLERDKIRFFKEGDIDVIYKRLCEPPKNKEIFGGKLDMLTKYFLQEVLNKDWKQDNSLEEIYFKTKLLLDSALNSNIGAHTQELVDAINKSLGIKDDSFLTSEALEGEDKSHVIYNLSGKILTKYPNKSTGEVFKEFLSDIKKNNNFSNDNPAKNFKDFAVVQFSFYAPIIEGGEPKKNAADFAWYMIPNLFSALCLEDSKHAGKVFVAEPVVLEKMNARVVTVSVSEILLKDIRDKCGRIVDRAKAAPQK